MFFQLFLIVEVSLVAKIMQSAKNTLSCGFKLISNSWQNPKMATFVGDVTGLEQRHHP